MNTCAPGGLAVPASHVETVVCTCYVNHERGKDRVLIRYSISVNHIMVETVASFVGGILYHGNRDRHSYKSVCSCLFTCTYNLIQFVPCIAKT